MQIWKMKTKNFEWSKIMKFINNKILDLISMMNLMFNINDEFNVLKYIYYIQWLVKTHELQAEVSTSLLLKKKIK